MIYGNSNNDFFPGIDSHGKILPPSPTSTGSTTASGAAFSSRLWILLHYHYIGGDLLISSYGDSLTKWVSGNSVTTNNFSYAGLQIADTPDALTPGANAGRFAEWKNNANSAAVLFSDRLYVPTETANAAVQSLWTTQKGDWKGNVVWGDVHAGFEQSNHGFTTKYNGISNTHDNLFVTAAAAGTSEGSTVPDANAMLIYY